MFLSVHVAWEKVNVYWSQNLLDKMSNFAELVSFPRHIDRGGAERAEGRPRGARYTGALSLAFQFTECVGQLVGKGWEDKCGWIVG